MGGKRPTRLLLLWRQGRVRWVMGGRGTRKIGGESVSQAVTEGGLGCCSQFLVPAADHDHDHDHTLGQDIWAGAGCKWMGPKQVGQRRRPMPERQKGRSGFDLAWP